MNLCGGYLNHYGDYSAANIECMSEYFYGTWVDNNSIDDVQNADLCLMFGNNPAETRMSGGGQIHNYVDAKILATHVRSVSTLVTPILPLAVKTNGFLSNTVPMRPLSLLSPMY